MLAAFSTAPGSSASYGVDPPASMPATSTTRAHLKSTQSGGGAPPRPRSAERLPRLHWTIESKCPLEWASLLMEIDAGFFSSPACLPIVDPRGIPLFCRLTRDALPVGVALVIGHRCTLTRVIRHYRLASPPVVLPGVDRAAAYHELITQLKRLGAAEIQIGSYEAEPGEPRVPGGSAGAMRLEFPVPIAASPEELLRRCSETHRRYIRRGITEEWRATPLDAATAPHILHSVQISAIDRVAARDPHRVALAEDELRFPADNPSLVPWGTRAYAAYGPEGLLGAALLGWAGRSVYYVMGGSTSYGYSRSAAAWFHWTLMVRFSRSGSRVYNLGGTPASGADSSDPAFGLYRFKSGFGSTPVTCRGTTLHLRPAHLKRDELLGRLSKLLRR